jgi:cell division protein FtsW
MLLVIMSALLVIGAVVVYAIGPGLTNNKNLPENYFSSKQLTAIALGIAGFVVASRVSLEHWKKYQWPIILLAGFVAVAVRFVGEEINGAHRWIQVGGFSFQAAELVKLAIVLWVAHYLARKKLEGKMQSFDVLKPLAVLAGLIIIIVAGMQSDLGSAAVMMAIIGVCAYIAGLPMKRILLVVCAVVALASIAIVSTPYRRDRVATFFNPEADCQAEGYQACQALITIGSGGLFGKGLGKSVQAYGYLPEPANDSIFAIVSEKFGFVGSITVLTLFWLLFKRIAIIARTAASDYARILVGGVLVWLSVQMTINVGAMIGLLPLKGITLPFVSYGGTSIIFVMIAMGIVFQASRYTDFSSDTTTGQSSERPLPIRGRYGGSHRGIS